MKKIALFTTSDYILNRWKNYLSSYNLQVINSINDLNNLKDSLLILSTSVNIKNEESIIEKLLENQNKILILDSYPKLENAQKWLSFGVQGYGNSLMSNSFLNSAVESVFEDLIWLIPEITTQLVKTFSKNTNNNSDVLKDLTKTEQQIALLLRDGFTNTQISEELNSSINTIKTHIKNIYYKLEVNDRISFINLFNKI